jgi:DNA-binding NarL/FixJ family response regulator
MDIILLTPVRLFADGLRACLAERQDVTVKSVVDSVGRARAQLAMGRVDLVLIDVTAGVNLDEVRLLASDHADVVFVAVGLIEQRQHVIHCGRAGFAGYVTRDATVDELCQALANAVAGRLTCPAHISGGLLRALFRGDCDTAPPAPERALTSRESEVLSLIGRGLSNKEIARELVLSVATVKHHVHNLLDKLHLARRAQAMRCVRDAPWLVELPARPADADSKATARGL